MSDESVRAIERAQNIIGTEGRPDYFVIAEAGPVVLGIKPLFQAGAQYVEETEQRASFAGFRIRAAINPAAGLVANVTAEAISGAFPGFAFEKLDGIRASLVIGQLVLLNDDLGEPEARIKAIEQQGFFEKVHTFLKQSLTVGEGTDQRFNDAELAELIRDCFIGAFGPKQPVAAQPLDLPVSDTQADGLIALRESLGLVGDPYAIVDEGAGAEAVEAAADSESGDDTPEDPTPVEAAG